MEKTIEKDKEAYMAFVDLEINLSSSFRLNSADDLTAP